MITLSLHAKTAWWLWPALWCLFPLSLVNEKLSDVICGWLINLGVTVDVR